MAGGGSTSLPRAPSCWGQIPVQPGMLGTSTAAITLQLHPTLWKWDAPSLCCTEVLTPFACLLQLSRNYPRNTPDRGHESPTSSPAPPSFYTPMHFSPLPPSLQVSWELCLVPSPAARPSPSHLCSAPHSPPKPTNFPVAMLWLQDPPCSALCSGDYVQLSPLLPLLATCWVTCWLLGCEMEVSSRYRVTQCNRCPGDTHGFTTPL